MYAEINMTCVINHDQPWWPAVYFKPYDSTKYCIAACNTVLSLLLFSYSCRSYTIITISSLFSTQQVDRSDNTGWCYSIIEMGMEGWLRK